MRLIKLFRSIGSEVPALEEEINNWIRESGARVVSVMGNIAPQASTSSSISGSFSGSDILVIIVYELPEHR